jgi:hypothetical protein
VAKSVPAVAVTVIVRGVLSPAVDKVAVASPFVSVVACVIATPPELAENDTTTPEIRSFAELRASTVIVAVAEPSEGIDVALLIAVSEAGVWTWEPLLVPLEVPLLVPPLEELSPVIVLAPPQAASRTAARQPSIANLRMSHILVGRS